MIFRSFLAFWSHNILLALLALLPGALASFMGSKTRVGMKGLIATGLVIASRRFQWTEPKHAFSF